MSAEAKEPVDKGSSLDRFLRLFTEIRPGEGFSAVLLALNVALLFAAYYTIRPLREAFLLDEFSAEFKSYLQVGNVFAMAAIVAVTASSPIAFRAVD